MINIVLAILFTSWLLISFRLFDLYKIDHLQAIIFNYLVCATIGFFFYGNYTKLGTLTGIDTWMVLAFATGSCFFPTFYLMAFTVKKVSVTVSTVASKISLVIPVSVSLFILNPTGEFGVFTLIGLLLGLGAIVLSSIKKADSTSATKTHFEYFLPALVFLGGGLVDVLINITNYKYLPTEMNSLFPFIAFSAAALSGTLVLTYRIIFLKEKLATKNLLGGIVLGIPNYLSIFFLLKALKDFDNNGAILFPVLNICVILLNALVAVIFFKEKLSKYNYVGLGLSIISLLLLLNA